jgi:hypothetical protein
VPQLVANSDNQAQSTAFIDPPRSLNAVRGFDGDIDQALAYAYPCPERRRKERLRLEQKAVSRVFAHVNPDYWRYGITISQGNGMSVSVEEATRRLNYIRVRLLKAIFGNSFRRKGVKITFLVFHQGSRTNGNQHFHALMAIDGKHDWCDLKVAQKIQSIERDRRKRPWEKEPAWIGTGKKTRPLWLTSQER